MKIDQKYFRPTEVEALLADPSRAQKKLQWKARIRFMELMKIMVDADMRAVGLEPVGEGDALLRKEFPNRWWLRD